MTDVFDMIALYAHHLPCGNTELRRQPKKRVFLLRAIRGRLGLLVCQVRKFAVCREAVGGTFGAVLVARFASVAQPDPFPLLFPTLFDVAQKVYQSSLTGLGIFSKPTASGYPQKSGPECLAVQV